MCLVLLSLAAFFLYKLFIYLNEGWADLVERYTL